MGKLTDSQLIVLAAAAARDDGAASVPAKMNKAAASKVGSSLVTRKLMREIKTKPDMPIWREDEDARAYSLIITAAGRKEIGVEDEGGASAATETVSPAKGRGKQATAPSTAVPAKPFREGSKQALIVKMLSAKNGVTLSAMEDATGWLPHTMRAALTGLRKKGFVLMRDRQPGQELRLQDRRDRYAGFGLTMARSKKMQPAKTPAADIDVLVRRISKMTIKDLRQEWRQVHGCNAPAGLTKDLIARALTYRLQERAFGGLSPRVARELRELGKPDAEPRRRVKAGSIIVREYDGLRHEVMVVPGGFCWQGKTFESLSTIAKAITGTNWNGPRFFGLRAKRPTEARAGEAKAPLATMPKRGRRSSLADDSRVARSEAST